MKAYKFQIWHEITNPITGQFIVNTERTQIVHAINYVKAREKVELKPKEFIYKTSCLGNVRKIIETRYEYIPLKNKKYERMS